MVRASDLLKDLPVDGPVILVNVNEYRCDGLVLISGSDAPIHIPLPNFSHKLATELKQRLRKFLSARKVRMREEDRGTRPVWDSGGETQSEIHFVLEVLWLNVVRPIFDALAYPVSFHNFFLTNSILKFCQVSCFVTATSNMVVSNWSSCIPPTSRRWNLSSNRETSIWILCFRLCGIVVYTHRQCSPWKGKGAR